jgi:hypothetical protein
VCVCMYGCVCACMHVRVWMCVDVRVCMCMYACACVDVRVCMCMYGCACVDVRVCMCVYACAYMDVRVQVAPPGAPWAVYGTPSSSSSVSLVWAIPALNGAPLVGCTAHYTPCVERADGHGGIRGGGDGGGMKLTSSGCVGCTTQGSVNKCLVSGLEAGVGYVFTVECANPAGTGPPSLPSSEVTPGQ